MKHLTKQASNSTPAGYNKKNKPAAIPFKTPVYANSPEIQHKYYQEEIAYLQKQVNQLNIIDNPREIIAICKEINKYQQALNQLNQKNLPENYLKQ